MRLHLMNGDELRLAYETDLTEAFPPSELKPLVSMEDLRAKGLYDPLCLLDEDGSVLGYALLWRHRDGRYILIDYLCVPASMRNRGIGAKLFAALRTHYSYDTVFIWESEAPTGDIEQDEMILRRLGFYKRCGGTILGSDCALFGVHFKDLALAYPMPPEEEILRKHQEIYRDQFTPERYAQYIQLPLASGEKPFEITDWTED